MIASGVSGRKSQRGAVADVPVVGLQCLTGWSEAVVAATANLASRPINPGVIPVTAIKVVRHCPGVPET